ncbi:MAG: hypothetical protein LBU79_06970 [Planctomycetota bacterium]|jgi:hypothetical protein|nr:hypothetical protein [Planctomycetota bacterium]
MSLGIDPASQQALQKTSVEATPSAGAASKTPDAAGSGEVERFQAAMRPPEAQLATNQPPAAVPPVAAPGSDLSVGDRIIQGISRVSDKIQTDRAAALETIGKNDLTQADLLKANFSMMESSNLVSLTSKVGEKISQGLKTLQQG